MSVLFLVTRPIMSGVPIFNQMRGRFTLLLYYVALSLCAPASTKHRGGRPTEAGGECMQATCTITIATYTITIATCTITIMKIQFLTCI